MIKIIKITNSYHQIHNLLTTRWVQWAKYLTAQLRCRRVIHILELLCKLIQNLLTKTFMKLLIDLTLMIFTKRRFCKWTSNFKKNVQEEYKPIQIIKWWKTLLWTIRLEHMSTKKAVSQFLIFQTFIFLTFFSLFKNELLK